MTDLLFDGWIVYIIPVFVAVSILAVAVTIWRDHRATPESPESHHPKGSP